MFYNEVAQGIILRIRLNPNSSSCVIKGIFTDAQGDDFLKINVVSVPEKGKANSELQSLLAKELKLPKNQIEIVAGQTDKYKKILLHNKSSEIISKLLAWAQRG